MILAVFAVAGSVLFSAAGVVVLGTGRESEPARWRLNVAAVLWVLAACAFAISALEIAAIAMGD